MNPILIERQDATFNDVMSLLIKYKKCNMVRPVGFGKTHLLVRIAEAWNGPVVYVYPRNIIAKSVMKSYVNNRENDIRFVTYQKLWRYLDRHGSFLENESFAGFRNGLVIFDESHFLGADLWKNIRDFILDDFPDVSMLGATATPIRTDGLDVLELFEGYQPFQYTLDDAIQDKIYYRPLVVTGTYDAKALVHRFYEKEQKSKLYKNKEERSAYLKELKEKLIQIEAIMNGPSMIKRNISLVYGENPGYLKFICFFARYERLYEQYKVIEGWFKEAFPSMTVNSIVLNKDVRDFSDMLNLHREEGRIDLIFCVDKLTYGYHDDEISGVILLRATESEIILSQQYGRALSVVAKQRAIIFDLLGALELVENSDYTAISVKSSVLKDNNENKRSGKSQKDGLLLRENVECISEYHALEEVSLIFDRRRMQRKNGVMKVLMGGVMPPWIACKELYLSDGNRLEDLIKIEGYEQEWSSIKDKWGDWKSKVERVN